jgi:hypothetical protein
VSTRRERVILELEDNFTAGAARAAAATQVLKREIEGLNGAGSSSNGGGFAKISKDVDSLSKSAVKGSAEIDKYSGRLRLLADVALVLGPAAIVAGAGLGGMAISAGVAGLALYGLGDALKALNKYQLDPTAANLKALNQEMDEGRSGRARVRPVPRQPRAEAERPADGRARRVPPRSAAGHRVADDSIPRGPPDRERPGDRARRPDSQGRRVAGRSRLRAVPELPRLRAFGQGPDVAEFVAALAASLAGIAEAAAPVGAVTLPILTKLLDVIAALANSPLGTPLLGAASAYSAYTLAASAATTVTAKFAAENAAARASMVGLVGSIAGVAIAIPVLSTVYDKLYSIGQTNGDIEKLVGNAGKLKDFGGDVERTTSGGVGGFLDKYNPDRIVKLGGYDAAKEGIQETDKALAQMVSSGNADAAEKAFTKISYAAMRQGASLDDLKKAFPEYTSAAAGSASATDSYGHAANNAAVQTETLGRADRRRLEGDAGAALCRPRCVRRGHAVRRRARERSGRCSEGQARHRREHQGWSREPPGSLAARCGVEQPVRRGAEQLGQVPQGSA